MAKRSSRFESLRESARALWEGNLLGTGKEPSRLLKFLHFWVLVWTSFSRNRCPVRASALSYTTLLALIPTLAVALSISSLFLKSAGENQIEQFIQQLVNRMVPPANIETNAIAFVPASTNLHSGAASTNLLVVTDTNIAAAVSTAATGTNAVVDTNAVGVAASAAEGTNHLGTVTIKDERVATAQKEAAQYIHRFIQNTYSGTLGATGMFFLFITSILTLTKIEEAFNDIWGVTRGRDWLTRVVNYLTTIVFGPALLFLALGLASGPKFQKIHSMVGAAPFIALVISKVLPVLVVCLCFAVFYKLVPNTKVHFSAALIGGVLAGTCWHIYNMLGFLLVSQAVNASKIYGSLAVVVLFMGGLYIVWYTVLFGAQVAYAFQNREAYLQEKLVENVNQRGREFVALRLMTCIGQRFQRGQPLATVPEMAKELGIPSRLIQQVLQVLLNAHLVVEVSREEPAYAPGRPLEGINAHHVLMAMRATQGQELLTRDEPVRAEVYGEFARIQEAEKRTASTVSMLDLVNRAHARLELTPPSDEAEIKLTHALTPPSTKLEPIEQNEAEPIEAKSYPIPSTPVLPKKPEPTPPPPPPTQLHPIEARPAATETAPIVEPARDEDREFPL
jgi:membrane protein